MIADDFQAPSVTGTLKRPVLIFICIAALCLAGYALYLARDAVFVLLISGLVASALHPAITWLEGKRVPKKIAVVGFFIIFMALIGTLAFVLGSILLDQGTQFIHHLPEYTQLAIEKIKTIPFLEHQGNILQSLSQKLSGVAEKGGAIVFSSLAYVFGVLGSFLSIFTIFIFTFFILSDTEYFKTTFYNLTPERHRERLLSVVTAIVTKVGAYVRGQLMVVSVTGILVAVGLSFLHIPYAYVLGILTALFDIVPVVGPLMAISVGSLITLGSHAEMLPWVLLVYLAAQQIENAVVFPFVMGKSIHIHPFWILLSILITSALIGVAGVILAVPLAITINIILQEYYVNGYLKPRQPVANIDTVSEATRRA